MDTSWEIAFKEITAISESLVFHRYSLSILSIVEVDPQGSSLTGPGDVSTWGSDVVWSWSHRWLQPLCQQGFPETVNTGTAAVNMHTKMDQPK